MSATIRRRNVPQNDGGGGGGDTSAVSSPPLTAQATMPTPATLDGASRCVLITTLVLAIAAVVLVVCVYVLMRSVDAKLEMLVPNSTVTSLLHESDTAASNTMANVVHVFRKRQHAATAT